MPELTPPGEVDAVRDEYDFDVALSFAGEDRDYVQEVNGALKTAGIQSFLDADYLADTWGEDLTEYFDSIYRKRARYAMLFISRHYAEKAWPRHERRSALARALEERSAYILPVRLDDAEVDGLRPTVGYLDARRTGINGLVREFLNKLSGQPRGSHGWPGDRAPRTQREVDEVCASQPPGWEYLFLAGVLYLGKEALEERYLDHELRHADRTGERVVDEDAFEFLRSAANEAGALVARINTLMEPAVQERAIGAPGAPGDPARIKRLAERWISLYEGMLDWSARIRGTGHSSRFAQSFELSAQLMDEPIENFREFVDELVAQMDQIPAAVASNESLDVTLILTLSIEEGLPERVTAEINRAAMELQQSG